MKKDSLKEMDKTDWFGMVYCSVLGFLAAVLVFIVLLGMLYGAGYYCYEGYKRWFSTSGMVSVGDAGYYYDYSNECFVKPYPNRKVLNGCRGLQYQSLDSIGIVCTGAGVDKYRYVNLNTMQFINEMVYSDASLFYNGQAFAIAQDTLYTLRADGSIISTELTTWIYASIDDIICYRQENDEDGDLVYTERKTDLLKYEDLHHNYGIMSADYVRLTDPIFSNITAVSTDVMFCEYFNSGYGVLINQKGELIK